MALRASHHACAVSLVAIGASQLSRVVAGQTGVCGMRVAVAVLICCKLLQVLLGHDAAIVIGMAAAVEAEGLGVAFAGLGKLLAVALGGNKSLIQRLGYVVRTGHPMHTLAQLLAQGGDMAAQASDGLAVLLAFLAMQSSHHPAGIGNLVAPFVCSGLTGLGFVGG